MRFPVSEGKDGARFAVRVVPRASRTAMVGVIGEGAEAAVKIAVQAPPVEGRANEALVEFLAEMLGVRRVDVAIAAGEHGRNKVVVVRGKRASEVAATVETRLRKL
ncbi:MAG TPA: DUF167 domain-containing protein [Acidobacteriaceae bacterium]|nr:DUF167 domain-containing protein [Acidobacteriaceae bacterium]